MSDSNRFKLDPDIVNMVGKTKGINYGHAIAKAFTDIGNIAEKQKENELKQIETDTKKLQYESIADTLADDRRFTEMVSSDDPKEYMKKNPFKTSKFVTLGNDFIDTSKNKLSEEQQKKHLAMFSNLYGNDVEGGIEKLKSNYENGKMDEEMYHNVVDLIRKETKTGMYKEQLSEKDKLGLLKTQTEIQKNLYDINNPKEYAPTATMKDYNADMKSKYGEDKTQWEPYHEYSQKWRQAQKLTGEATYNNIINTKIDQYSKKLETTDFANVDFNQALEAGKITPNEKRMLERDLASTREGKTLESQYGKYKMDFEAIRGQAQRFAKYANSKAVDTDVIQNATDIVKSYIPDLNPSQEELENFEFRSDFLNVSATILKLQSGLTVSDKERANFEKSMGTLSKNKKVNFVGLKQKILDKRNALVGVKNTAPEYFNIKYGDTLRSLDNSLNIIDGYLNNNTEQTNTTPAPIYDPSKKETIQTEQTTPTILKVSDFEKHGIKVGY